MLPFQKCPLYYLPLFILYDLSFTSYKYAGFHVPYQMNNKYNMSLIKEHSLLVTNRVRNEIVDSVIQPKVMMKKLVHSSRS